MESYFAQLLEEDQVPLLKLSGLSARRRPQEVEILCPAGHHVALCQQLVICNITEQLA